MSQVWAASAKPGIVPTSQAFRSFQRATLRLNRSRSSAGLPRWKYAAISAKRKLALSGVSSTSGSQRATASAYRRDSIR